MAAILALGAFGGFVGSFLNVVIYRVPRQRSVVAPRSACGSCGTPIRWHDNIPLFSWIALRGRCRDCSAPISVRYPLIELGSAVFFGLITAAFVGPIASAPSTTAAVGAVLALLAYLYLGAISVALAAIDLATQRLPNSIVLPGYLVGGALLTAASLLASRPEQLLGALAGLLALGGVYLAIAVITRGMGFGDVKLAGVLGMFLGWLGGPELFIGWVSGFLLGGLFGVILLATRRARRGTAVPFGPWMLAGAWLGILVGPAIAAAVGAR